MAKLDIKMWRNFIIKVVEHCVAHVPFVSSAEIDEFMPSNANTCQEDKRKGSQVSHIRSLTCYGGRLLTLTQVITKCSKTSYEDEETFTRKG